MSGNLLTDSQSASKYGTPNPDPGSEFALNRTNSPTTEVDPYSEVNRTSPGKAMTWRNTLNTAGAQVGSFMQFGGGTIRMAPPSAIGVPDSEQPQG
jgi:hypothetical protein